MKTTVSSHFDSLLSYCCHASHIRWRGKGHGPFAFLIQTVNPATLPQEKRRPAFPERGCFTISGSFQSAEGCGQVLGSPARPCPHAWKRRLWGAGHHTSHGAPTPKPHAETSGNAGAFLSLSQEPAPGSGDSYT